MTWQWNTPLGSAGEHLRLQSCRWFAFRFELLWQMLCLQFAWLLEVLSWPWQVAVVAAVRGWAREVQDSHSPLVCEMTLELVEVALVVLPVSGWRQEEYLQSSGKKLISIPLTAAFKPWVYRVFSHDVTADILVSQNNETATMLVS